MRDLSEVNRVHRHPQVARYLGGVVPLDHDPEEGPAVRLRALAEHRVGRPAGQLRLRSSLLLGVGIGVGIGIVPGAAISSPPLLRVAAPGSRRQRIPRFRQRKSATRDRVTDHCQPRTVPPSRPFWKAPDRPGNRPEDLLA